MSKMNEIYLRRRNKIMVSGEGTSNVAHLNYIATVIKNLESVGYRFSENAIEKLKTMDSKHIVDIYFEIINIIRELTGSDRIYIPFYPNFPNHVMNVSEAELLMDKLIYAFSGFQYLPEEGVEERPQLQKWLDLKVIDFGDTRDFKDIFTNIILSKTSISDTDKNDLSWFAEHIPSEFIRIISSVEQVPLRENAALISSLCIKYVDWDINVMSFVYENTVTANDVLRLAVAMSDGDISLASPTIFKSFKRKHRRLLLNLLSLCGNIEEDMKRYKERWIRLGERLHPSEYPEFEKVVTAFHKLRNKIHISTYGGRLEEVMKLGDIELITRQLKERPGEFARKLDSVIRNYSMEDGLLIVEEFSKVASQVSTTVLLQVYKHFKERNKSEKDFRTFFPKGNLAKSYTMDNRLPRINSKITQGIVTICSDVLIERFSNLDSLGNVYIDPKLSNYLVPFSQRSASKSLRTIVRGSKIDIPEGVNIIRPYIFWSQDKNSYHVDLDLSLVVLDESWNKIFNLYYNSSNMRDDRLGLYHSGDVRSGLNGGSEFVDINIDRFVNGGGRYAIMAINNFTNQKFVDLPECFAGWMGRDNHSYGEIFDPRTLVDRFDLTAESKMSIPFIFDLVERKAIWVDLSTETNPSYVNNVVGNSNSIINVMRGIMNMDKPNLLELITLHAKARGTIVDSIDKADVVFSTNTFPFETDTIMSQYL